MDEFSAQVADLSEETLRQDLRNPELSVQGSVELQRSRLFRALALQESPSTSKDNSARTSTPEPCSPIDKDPRHAVAESTSLNRVQISEKLADTVPL